MDEQEEREDQEELEQMESPGNTLDAAAAAPVAGVAADGPAAGTQPTVIASAALAYQDGSSDKVWGAVVIAHADGDGATMVSCWGKRGASLSVQPKPFPTLKKAQDQFDKKVKEKVGERYVAIPLTQYGIAETLQRCATSAGFTVHLDGTVDDEEGGATPTTNTNAARAAPEDADERPRITRITVLPPDELDTALADERFGITEKVNGARCVARCDVSAGEEGRALHIRTYNRRGVEQFSIPDGVQRALTQLKTACLIDGERMEGQLAGTFVAFDLLEWQGEDIRTYPYSDRITILEQALLAEGIIECGAPTLTEATQGSVVGEFALLTPATTAVDKRDVFARIRAEGGEGIVVRTLAGPSTPGDTRHERKHKFVNAIDVFAIGIKPGVTGAGSVRMGLVREDDGAVIEVGTVRSGLTDTDVEAIAAALGRGERPVLEVTFLPARTVGITLVEPVAHRRDDKPAGDCTTAQLIEILGPERDRLIAAAPAARV